MFALQNFEVEAAYGEGVAIPGQDVGDGIRSARHVTKDTVEFGDGGKVALLSFGDWVCLF